MTAAIENYSIGRPIEGDLVLSRLVLTGWGATGALATWTERGRVWARLSGGVLTLYRNSGVSAADRLCSGAVSSGSVTLTALNGSGITGSASVSASQDGACTVIISYATEDDVSARYVGLANEAAFLNRGGLQRFEWLLTESKREVDLKLIEDMAPYLPVKSDGTPDLTVLSDPRQANIVRAQVWFAEAILYGYRGALDAQFIEAERYRRKIAREELRSRQILVDRETDAVADHRAPLSQRVELA